MIEPFLALLDTTIARGGHGVLWTSQASASLLFYRVVATNDATPGSLALYCYLYFLLIFQQNIAHP